MKNITIVGAQWGDEGKGKVVDLLTRNVDLVVRFAGGSNAGHTLVVDGQKIVVHSLPSGIVHQDKTSVLGDGMVIDPEGILEELAQLDLLGLCPEPERLRISGRAHLVLPYHRELDRLREGTAQALGTTRRGIGPAYEDKVARRGLRACDLKDVDRLRRRLASTLESANERIRQLGGSPVDLQESYERLVGYAAELRPYVDDTATYLHDALRAGKRALFEGAQGILLDVDHGTYPFVTSSTTLAGGACGGTGVAPRHLGKIIGVAKTYVTRVGEGPFPSELEGAEGDRLRELGGEFGATTGRPRRCGWLDLPALRYAVRVAGLDWLALTKLDVLAGVENPKVCVAYRLGDKELESLPPDPEDLAALKPVFRDIPNLGGSCSDAQTYDELPEAARSFVEMVEKEAGVGVCLVSLGPERERTVVRQSSLGSQRASS